MLYLTYQTHDDGSISYHPEEYIKTIYNLLRVEFQHLVPHMFFIPPATITYDHWNESNALVYIYCLLAMLKQRLNPIWD